MIVDCHTHINCEADDSTLSAHLEAAETVDVCIVLAEAGQASGKTNEKLSEYVGKHKEKLVGFAHIDPTKDNISVKNLSSNQEKLGLSGTVLYCSSCGFHPAHSRAMRFYESAQQLGLPVFFHNGGSLSSEAALDYAQPYLLDQIAREFGDLKMVIGSMGSPFPEQTLCMIEKHENVYADLTMRSSNVWKVYNTVVAASEQGVMDKLLFGSGFPLGNAGEYIETLLGFNKLLGDTSLPTVPRGHIRHIVERDTLKLLGMKVSR